MEAEVEAACAVQCPLHGERCEAVTKWCQRKLSIRRASRSKEYSPTEGDDGLWNSEEGAGWPTQTNLG